MAEEHSSALEYERIAKDMDDAAKAKLGRKFDNGKLEWSHFLWDEAEEIMEILQFGAKKYAWGNFAYVPNARERYFSALIRHVKAWNKGEEADPETGKSHLAHAGCCLMFLMYLDNHENDPKLGEEK
jgi:hypothetical protein